MHYQLIKLNSNPYYIDWHNDKVRFKSKIRWFGNKEKHSKAQNDSTVRACIEKMEQADEELKTKKQYT